MESTRASSAPVHTSSDIGTYPVSSLASRRRPQPLQAVYVRAQVVKDQQTRWGGDVGRHRQRRVARLHDGNLADGVAYHSLNLDPAHALPLVGERKQMTRGALYKRGHALPVNGIAVDHRRTHHVRALKAGRRPERGHAGNCLRKGGECHAVE